MAVVLVFKQWIPMFPEWYTCPGGSRADLIHKLCTSVLSLWDLVWSYGTDRCKAIFSVLPNSEIRLGLPWWRSGWESACQCRAHGFEPWSRKIPRAAEQLGPWATITEPARLEPVLRNRRGRDSERPAHSDEEWPPLATTGESPRTETKTQHSHKSINQSINQSGWQKA